VLQTEYSRATVEDIEGGSNKLTDECCQKRQTTGITNFLPTSAHGVSENVYVLLDQYLVRQLF
jgi:hypothetical protein